MAEEGQTMEGGQNGNAGKCLVYAQGSHPHSHSQVQDLEQGCTDTRVLNEDCFCVPAETLKALIFSQELVTKMNLLVAILTGLKDCGKTNVIQHVFNASVKPIGSNKVLPQVGEVSDHGLSWYQVAVAGDSQNGHEFEWSFFTRSSGYLNCFVSALLQYADKNNHSIQIPQPPTNRKFFDNDILDAHFHTILEGLHSYFSRSPDIRGDRKFLEGLSLINVWDVEGSNVAARLVLSMLAGKLKHSFSIVGLNLLDLVWKAKDAEMAGLLQFAHLTKDVDKERKEAALAAGLLTSAQSEMLSEEDKGQLKYLLKELVARNAKPLGVETCISENVPVLDAKKPTEIKMMLETQVMKLDETMSIPLSWVLLCSAFFKSGVLFVEEKKLREVSSKLGITEESFGEFLATFTAMGSIIYNPHIPALKQNVILNPVDFCSRLDNLFNARFNGDLERGVVPMSYLRRIFGRDAEFFKDVLVSSKHAIQVDIKKIKYLPGSGEPPFPERPCFFLPIICKKVSQVKKHADSLFLQVKSTFVPNNIGQILVEQLLLHTSVSLIPTEFSNEIHLEYKSTDEKDFLHFSVLFHADACEILLKSNDTCNQEVVKAVRTFLLASCCSIKKSEKEKFVPFGTEVQKIGVMCTVQGGFHSFPTDEPCQECAGPVNTWQPVYAEVIDEDQEIEEIFKKHPEFTPEVLTRLGMHLRGMCKSVDDVQKLMGALGQPDESVTESNAVSHVVGALHTCAGRNDNSSSALHKILHSLNPEYGAASRVFASQVY